MACFRATSLLYRCSIAFSSEIVRGRSIVLDDNLTDRYYLVMEDAMRTTQFTLDGVTYEVPDRWLQGYQAGHDGGILAAMHAWADQAMAEKAAEPA